MSTAQRAARLYAMLSENTGYSASQLRRMFYFDNRGLLDPRLDPELGDLAIAHLVKERVIVKRGQSYFLREES